MAAEDSRMNEKEILLQIEESVWRTAARVEGAAVGILIAVVSTFVKGSVFMTGSGQTEALLSINADIDVGKAIFFSLFAGAVGALVWPLFKRIAPVLFGAGPAIDDRGQVGGPLNGDRPQ
jgi:hypothetical protein